MECRRGAHLRKARDHGGPAGVVSSATRAPSRWQWRGPKLCGSVWGVGPHSHGRPGSLPRSGFGSFPVVGCVRHTPHTCRSVTYTRLCDAHGVCGSPREGRVGPCVGRPPPAPPPCCGRRTVLGALGVGARSRPPKAVPSALPLGHSPGERCDGAVMRVCGPVCRARHTRSCLRVWV